MPTIRIVTELQLCWTRNYCALYWNLIDSVIDCLALNLSVVYRITVEVRTSSSLTPYLLSHSLPPLSHSLPPLSLLTSSLSLLPPQLVHMSEATQIPPSYNDTLTLLVDGRVSALE